MRNWAVLAFAVVTLASYTAQAASGSRRDPAPVGTTLTVQAEGPAGRYTARVTLLEVRRGEAAWALVQAANPMNDQAPAGHEYLAVRLRFELASMDDEEAALPLSHVMFRAVSSSGKEYDPLIAVVPPYPALTANLYVGAVHEGWAVFLVATDDSAPLITFGRDYLGRGGIWFRAAP